MGRIYWCSFIFIILIATSCKSDKKVDTPPTETLEDTISNNQSNRYQIYFTTVDNLRVREGAAKSSKVIDKLKEETLVYSDGSESDITEKILLRGIKHNSPYKKITYDKNEGWIYGGGLYKIYDEGEGDSFTESLESLIVRINNKEKSLLNRAKYILNVARQEKSGSEEWNDVLYQIAEYNMSIVAKNPAIYPLLEKHEWTQEEYTSVSDRTYDMQSSDFSKEFSSSGFMFIASEGIVEPILNPITLKNVIEGPFSPAMESYISIRETAAQNVFFSDESLVSPLSMIVEYTVAIEKFIEKHPHFPRVKSIRSELEYLHKAILYGTENTPAYDYSTNELHGAWQSGWQQYLTSIENGMIKDRIENEINKPNKK